MQNNNTKKTIIISVVTATLTLIVITASFSLLSKKAESDKEQVRIRTEQLKVEEDNKELKDFSNSLDKSIKDMRDKSNYESDLYKSGKKTKDKFEVYNRDYIDPPLRSAIISKEISNELIAGYEKDCKLFFNVIECNTTRAELESIVLSEDLTTREAVNKYADKTKITVLKAFRNPQK